MSEPAGSGSANAPPGTVQAAPQMAAPNTANTPGRGGLPGLGENLPSVQAEPDGLTADEERQLGQLLARQTAAAGAGSVAMKVEEPHSELHFGGVTLSREWSNVPAHIAGALAEAAERAGVKLSQQEGS
jgi:hypothetical protein